jgi:Xaa-Pro aminopeptidase
MNNRDSVFTHRIRTLQDHLLPHQAQLLSAPTDVCYFSGFTTLVPEEREALLIVTSKTAHLFYAHFSPYEPIEGIQAHKGCSIEELGSVLGEIIDKTNLSELLITPTNLVVSEYNALKKMRGVTILDDDGTFIWNQRSVKDQVEIELMKEAAIIANQTMNEVLSSLTTGMTELELCGLIESKLKQHGSEQPAFPTIVAFGPHAALPHHQPTHTVLKPNTVVLLDFGATYHAYRSDMTRTTWFGSKPSKAFAEVETIILNAYTAAMETLTNTEQGWPTARLVDQAARATITGAGFGKQFIHTTGHGLGLDIHEKPSINWKNEDKLKENMIITIEPGIYLEGEFGYRHENTVLLTKTGAVELTT